MPWSAEILPASLGFAVAVSASTAIAALALRKLISRELTVQAELLAAGLLLTTLALHLLPETLSASPLAGAWFLLGFLAATLFAGAARAGSGAALWIGPTLLAVHSFGDGAVHVTVAALPLSWASLPALIAHELPETLAAFVLLQRAGLAPGQAALGGFALAGMTTLTGGAAFGEFARQADPAAIDALAAASAGVLLHVVTGHLLRPFQERPSAGAAGALTLGLTAGLSLSLLVTGGHPVHAHAAAGPDFRPFPPEREIHHAID